ncbi:carbonic anhydrase/acetyltransferase isoleucine patch superfamily-like protein [Oceanimonas sp. GK1]|uniref:acetyltransferase n=1 Tax=Oceanimonas sp. (strain GK1 / IBRC-M 10197) TaxID=511062 RepID=UPI0002495481|nr:acetyltransferase [Oceanimonas sp. GK1]AEY02436.1 carbonic anhydrase/acetyltransferase isoleucine patch superfamily-like protein [Oceanimonas sp. GK1]
MTKPLVILGAGGHAAGLAEILKKQGHILLGVVSPHPLAPRGPLADVPHINDDEALLEQFGPEQAELVNGVGALPGQDLNWRLFQRFTGLGYRFASVISPHAILSEYVTLGQGVQIMAGAIVQAGVQIGGNTLLNTGCIVEHDCCIGAHNHLAPGATLSGGVITGEQVHVGTGANIIQGITIGKHATIGAGTTIARDVIPYQKLIPAPSRIIS